jgi:hypothetical protein
LSRAKGQIPRYGKLSQRLSAAADDARSISPTDTDGRAPHDSGNQEAPTLSLSTSLSDDYVERSSLSPGRTSTNYDAASPSGQRASRHRRSDAVTMSREESIQCKSCRVSQYLSSVLIRCKGPIMPIATIDWHRPCRRFKA